MVSILERSEVELRPKVDSTDMIADMRRISDLAHKQDDEAFKPARIESNVCNLPPVYQGDPEEIYNSVFKVAGKRYLFARKSLICIGPKNVLRSCIAKIVLRKEFDHFITICILVNSLLLASKSYKEYYDVSYVS